MGGKARIRKWLVNLFPQAGNRYIELFAGRGNVFYYAKSTLDYNYWILNDIDINFMYSITKSNFENLPEKIEKEDFEYWKSRGDMISKLIEPRITYGGKGYDYGYSGDCGTHIGYRKENYKENCKLASYMLDKSVTLFECDWKNLFNIITVDENDFVYCDPPYHGSESIPYPNINHEDLLTFLKNAKFKWALSGYESSLYLDILGEPQNKKVRNSEIKSSNHGKKVDVIECLWRNYD